MIISRLSTGSSMAVTTTGKNQSQQTVSAEASVKCIVDTCKPFHYIKNKSLKNICSVANRHVTVPIQGTIQ